MKSTVKKRVILGAVIVALLAIITVAVVLVLNQPKSPVAPSCDGRIYWNVDKNDYLASADTGYVSTRMKRKDGYYHVKMAVDGEVVDMLTADIHVVTKMDNDRIMGLELDENGIVTDVVILEDMPGVLREQTGYVESVSGSQVIVNSSGVLRGVQSQFDISDIPVYYGTTDSSNPLVGRACKPGVDDTFVTILNKDNDLICAYAIPYKEPGDVYWNIERMYNSTLAMTTREPDETGTYVYEMACNGELVTVKTRSADVARKIDAASARCIGLAFDSDGYAVGTKSATSTVGGTTFGSWYHVMELTDTTVTAKRVVAGANFGAEVTGVFSRNVKIFNCSGTGDYIGQPTELMVGDQIHGLTDSRGRVAVVFVVSRRDGTMKVAWNVERKWDSTNKLTTRTPDADGWYRIKLLINGEQITAKTQNKAFVQKIDSAACYGVKLSGDEIVGITTAVSAAGVASFGSSYDVTAISGKQVTIERLLDGTKKGEILTATLADGCEIYDVSSIADVYGARTTLRVGDRMYGFLDMYGNICCVFVSKRPVDVPIYWNNSRQYDSAKAASKRTPDGDGYYHITLSTRGEQVELKTKDKAIIDKIDSYAARCFGLKVNGDVITKVYPSSTTKQGFGGINGSWVTVTKVSGNTITAVNQQPTHEDYGKVHTIVLTDATGVYCVNNSYVDHYGEKTTLRVGDVIHVLVNNRRMATNVFVVTRKMTYDIYWDRMVKPCEHSDSSIKWTDWDGDPAKLEDGGHYKLTKDLDLKDPDGITLKGVKVSIDLNGHTIGGEGRAFWLPSGTVTSLNICDHTGKGKIATEGKVKENQSGGAIRISGNSGMVRLYGVTVTQAAGKDGKYATVNESGLIQCSGMLYLYQSTLTGGHAKVAGNLMVSSSGQAILRECVVENGTATTGSGGNIRASGTTGVSLTLIDTKVTGGRAIGDGDGIYLGKAETSALKISGNTQIVDNEGSNLYMEETGNVVIMNDELAKTAKIGITMATYGAIGKAGKDLSGYFVSDNDVFFLVYANGELRLDADQNRLHVHSICGGHLTGDALAAHRANDGDCKDVLWTELTTENFASFVEENSSTQFKFRKGNGYYYLGEDIDIEKALIETKLSETGNFVAVGRKIQLDLNGHTLTTYGAIQSWSSSVVITDCVGTGSIKRVFGSYAIGVANNANVNNTVSIYGGTIEGVTNGLNAVSGDTNNGKIRIYGGTILGKGSNTAINLPSTLSKEFELDIYGGEIRAVNGAAVTVNSPDVTLGIHSGTFTGGKAITVAGGVTVEGAPKVDNIYLTSGQKITVGKKGLKTGASIGVSMEIPGVFCTTSKDLSAYFTSVDENCDLVYENGELKLDADLNELHIHCICGGNLTGDALAVHLANDGDCKDILWTELTTENFASFVERNNSNTQFKFKNDDSCYYLGEDIDIRKAFEGTALDATWTFMAVGRRIRIDLNGHTLTTYGAIQSWSSPVIICDCKGTGKLVRANTASSNNFVLGTANNSGNSITVYGGTIQGPATVVNAANGAKNDSKIRIYGGKLVSTGSAAAIDVSAATLNAGFSLDIYGGEITSAGGAAFTVGNATAKLGIHDGTFTGTAASTAAGGVTVEGAPKVDNIYLTSGQKITVGKKGLKTGASIGVTMADPGVFCTTSEDLSAYFTSVDEKCNLVYKNGEMKLEKVATPAAEKDLLNPTEDQKKNMQIDIYLIGGQSNAVGNSKITSAKEGERDLNVYKNVLYYASCYFVNGTIDGTIHTDYAPVQEGLGKDDTRIGPEMGMAQILNDRYSGDNQLALILKCAAGGSSIMLHEETDADGNTYVCRIPGVSEGTQSNFYNRGSWYPDALESEESKQSGENRPTGYLTRTLKNNITEVYNQLIETGYQPENIRFVAINWMQGEVDRNNPGIYNVAFNILMQEIRDYISETTKADYSELPIVVGEISETFDSIADSAVAANKAFIAAQRRLQGSIPYLTVINSSKFQMNTLVNGEEVILGSDPDHWAYGDMLQIGRMFADAIVSGVGKGDLHTHCECDGVKPEGHTCKAVNWIRIATAKELVNCARFSGDVYVVLDDDIALTAAVKIQNGTKLHICLNGHTITQPANDRAFFNDIANDPVELSICDCKGTGKVQGSGTKLNKQGALVFLYRPNSVFNLYSGTLTGGQAGVHGGNVDISSKCTFNMYGGTIENGTADLGGNVYVNNGGTFHMYGGKITGGSANNNGGGVYVNKTGKMNVSGGVQITGNTVSNVYLAEGATLNAAGLTTDAKIGITMAVPGTIGTAGTDVSQYFTSDQSGYCVDFADGSLILAEGEVARHKDHCICGGVDDHTHTAVAWEPWDGTTELTSGTYYYLTQDVTVDVNGVVVGGTGDTTVNLCLNGFNLYSEGRAFYVKANGKLNICDHTGSGEIITKGNVTDNGAGGAIRFSSSNKTALNLYGITVRKDGDTVVTEGGLISISGTARMVNCTVIGGLANRGGNFVVAATGKLTLVNCTVKDGFANVSGGNIRLGGNNASNHASLTLIDTVVTGGSTNGDGGGIYVLGTNSDLMISGATKVTENNGSNIYFAGTDALAAGVLTSDAKIGVTMATPGTFGTAKTDVSQYFTSDQSGYHVDFADGSLILAEGEVVRHKDHCICGGVDDHTHEVVAWEPWDGTTELTSGTYYYLTQDVTVDVNGIEVGGTNDTTVNLCLNGFNLYSEGRAFYVKANGKLNICDHTGSGEIITKGNVTDNGAGGAIRFGSSSNTALNLYGITVRKDGNTVVADGGLISVSGTARMVNCTVIGGVANKGGNILVSSVGKLTMVKCTVKDGFANENGGNIRVSGNKATNRASVTLIDTVVTGGSTNGDGGGVYVLGTNSDLTVSGATKVTENNGSNIYFAGTDALTASGLTSDAKIGVTMAAPGTFGIADTDVSQYFTSDRDGFCVRYSDGKLTLAEIVAETVAVSAEAN